MDAGPMVAIVDADDQHHETCVAAVKALREPLGTIWPAIAEAMYFLADLPDARSALWEMLERRAIQLLILDLNDIPRMRELMRKYADRRIDLADAALIAVAEREGIQRIFTVDRRDFAVYRLHGRVRPTIVP